MPNIGGFPDFDLTASLDYSQIGLPPDPVSSAPPPGLEASTSLDQTPNLFGKLQQIWDSGVADAESAVTALEQTGKNAYGGVKDVTATVYGDLKSGAGTVFSDVTRPLSSIFSSAYTYLIFGVIVIGGVIYFAGKSGALRVSKVV